MAYSDKFGITSAEPGIIQPKLKYKFKVEFSIPNSIPITRDVLTVDRPTMQYADTEIHSYNSVAHFAGKGIWQPINLVMRDSIDNGAQRAIQFQMLRQGDHLNQVSPRAGEGYKFTTRIYMLDGGQATAGGEGVFEQWTLEGCWFVSVAYDSTDYSSSEAMTITTNIRYDYAAIDLDGGATTFNSALGNE